MAELKSVVKDTAIYGLSSIIGRFLNYLLVPLYTAVLPAGSGASFTVVPEVVLLMHHLGSSYCHVLFVLGETFEV